MKIGLRTIKTGIAVGLSILIAPLLEIKNPFFVVISAFIAMQPTVSDSWRTGINRLLGTSLGAAVGLGFVLISSESPILTGLGTIVLISIMNHLKLQDSIVMASIVFAGVFFNAEGEYIDFAFRKLIDTSLGIGIALIINFSIYPPVYHQKAFASVEKALKEILGTIIEMLEILLDGNEKDLLLLDDHLGEISFRLQQSEKMLLLQIKDEKLMSHGSMHSREMLDTVTQAKVILQHLHPIRQILGKDIHKRVIAPVREAMMKNKFLLKELEPMVPENCLKNNKLQMAFSSILSDIQETKDWFILNAEHSNFPVDDVINLLVFLYNLEEIISIYCSILKEPQ
ncbi:FUSC family protein [Geosporobacter ferrireducens]|nr:aromatic acid exporter family protein [Geosporobacter ferrireducens]